MSLYSAAKSGVRRLDFPHVEIRRLHQTCSFESQAATGCREQGVSAKPSRLTYETHVLALKCQPPTSFCVASADLKVDEGTTVPFSATTWISWVRATIKNWECSHQPEWSRKGDVPSQPTIRTPVTFASLRLLKFVDAAADQVPPSERTSDTLYFHTSEWWCLPALAHSCRWFFQGRWWRGPGDSQVGTVVL